jgi:uncharacterized protein (DUF736 family)
MSSKDNSGAMFKEEKKSEKHPDYKGSCMINGEVVYVAGWVNISSEGKKYLSLKFTPKSEQAKYSKQDTSATSKPEFEKSITTNDNDLPF